MAAALDAGLGAAMVVAAVAILSRHVGIAAFVISNCLLNFSWNFSVAFQYAAANAADPTGHATAVTPAFHTAWAAVGPAIAALLNQPHDYTSVLWLVSLGVVVSQLCIVLAARVASPVRPTEAA